MSLDRERNPCRRDAYRSRAVWVQQRVVPERALPRDVSGRLQRYNSYRRRSAFLRDEAEAFSSRGRGDFLHHDIEDVIALVDERATLISEIAVAPDDVRNFVAQSISGLLSNPRFLEDLSGNLAGDEASQSRLPLVLDRLRQIAELLSQSENEARKRPSRSTRSKVAATASAARGSIGRSLQSSNLYSAHYDADSAVLTIEFRNGRVYEYYAVPPTIYDGLMRASSKGRYHHQWIRDRYRYGRVG